MRGIAAVALAGVLSFGIFQTWRRASSGQETALAGLEAQVDSRIARWVQEGLPNPNRLLTIVLAAPFSGEPTALPVSGRKGFLAGWSGDNGAGAFLRAFGAEPEVVTWNMAAVPSPGDGRARAAFARILVRAADAGGRVSLVAQGDAAAFALAAAAEAGRGRPSPAVSRVVGVGARFPGTSPESIDEWDGMWTEPDRLSGTFHLESRSGQGPAQERELYFEQDSWTVVVMRVARMGARAYEGPSREALAPPSGSSAAPLRRVGRGAPGRRAEATRSGLDMLVKENGPAVPAAGPTAKSAAELPGAGALADSGWTYLPPPGFRRWEIGRTNDYLQTWEEPPFSVSLQYRPGHVENASKVCADNGKTTVPTTQHGRPAEVCAGIRSGGDFLSDYFTILNDGKTITALYRYPRDRRGEKMAALQTVIEALSPASP